MDKANVVYTYNGILLSVYLKRRNPAICDYVDEAGGPYAKGNKSDTDRQILYNLPYMWNLK